MMGRSGAVCWPSHPSDNISYVSLGFIRRVQASLRRRGEGGSDKADAATIAWAVPGQLPKRSDSVV